MVKEIKGWDLGLLAAHIRGSILDHPVTSDQGISVQIYNCYFLLASSSAPRSLCPFFKYQMGSCYALESTACVTVSNNDHHIHTRHNSYYI